MQKLREALRRSVEREKETVLTARGESAKMANERKLAILAARERTFWRIQEMRQERDDYSENICKELNVTYLHKFHQRSQTELAEFLELFNLTPNNMINEHLMDPDSNSKKAQLFQEVCYVSRMTALDCLNF